MGTELVEQIERRVAALQAEREQVRQQAERKLAAYDGAIEELQRLLAQAEPQKGDN